MRQSDELSRQQNFLTRVAGGVQRMSLLHLLALSLNAPSTKSSSHARARLVSRRQHLQTAAALIALPPLSAAADQCETDGAACELVIPQQTLLAGLASAPVRHVTVTGAPRHFRDASCDTLQAADRSISHYGTPPRLL